MVADRYIKLVLTVIAVELLWLGLRDAPTAHAQQKAAAPMEVVVTGVRLGQQGYSMLPVVVMGGAQRLAGINEVRGIEPLVVRIPDPIQATINGLVAVGQPLTVKTGAEPLVVDVLPGRPTQRPGH